MPFLRKSRPEHSTGEIDSQERDWWNKYSPLIEVVWGLPDEMSAHCRKPYLVEARNFFLSSWKAKNPEKVLKVLEIACGSGWPGRFLSSSLLKVTGIDFSESQIQLARSRAGNANCDYRLCDVNDIGPTLKSGEFDGVFVHCALHHLSGAELKNFAKDLAEAPLNTVVVFVEPVYHDCYQPLLAPLRKALNVLFKVVFSFCKRANPVDDRIDAQVEAMNRESDEQGWFLSPKEVPLSRQEIFDLFSESFSIAKIEPVTHLGQRMAQNLVLLKDREKALRQAGVWVPLFQWLDRAMNQLGLLKRLEKDYLFSAIYLKRKAP